MLLRAELLVLKRQNEVARYQSYQLIEHIQRVKLASFIRLNCYSVHDSHQTKQNKHVNLHPLHFQGKHRQKKHANASDEDQTDSVCSKWFLKVKIFEQRSILVELTLFYSSCPLDELLSTTGELVDDRSKLEKPFI